MSQINYKKVFSKLSHIKALSHDQKFDEIVQSLITYSLIQSPDAVITTEKLLTSNIDSIYGIRIRLNVIQSNLDKLLNSGKVIKDRKTKQYFVNSTIAESIRSRILETNELECTVKENWFKEISNAIKEIEHDQHEVLWTCLKSYLYNVFEQHGIQTLRLLRPTTPIDEDDQKSLILIAENVLKNHNSPYTKEIFSLAINQFITKADEVRTNYISQLADATFTSFALTSDAETVNFLNSRYNSLSLFLDTNFIFGILDLHKNNEDASAREILEEVKRNRLPFKLVFHPETLAEFKRAFDNKALLLRATKWVRESSRLALEVDGLSPLEELFHKQNIDHEIDPAVFLDKYDHVDLILKDLGLTEYVSYRTSDLEHAEIEEDIQEYQAFYESTPGRRAKSYSGFKHDIVVLREVRSLNPRKTKFLESNSFFISSDYVLGKFEKKHYKKNWEIGYVVSPSVFLQLIRPFIQNDYQSNKRFVDTFSIPDLRSLGIDYTTTRSKTLQILNDSYHETSFETKVKILRDQVLLEKLDKLNANYEQQAALIESQIALENQLLLKQKQEAEQSVERIKKEKEALINEKVKVEQEASNKDSELETLKEEIDLLRKQVKGDRNRTIYEDELKCWERERALFINDRVTEKRKEYINSSKYCVKPILILFTAAIATPLIVRFYNDLKTTLEENKYSEWWLISGLLVLFSLAAYDLFFRTYLADKDKVKNGLLWIKTFGLKKRKNLLLEKHSKSYEDEYDSLNKKPELEFL